MAAPSTGPVMTGRPVASAANWLSSLLLQPPPTMLSVSMRAPLIPSSRSESVETYEPHHTPQWEAAYQKLLSFGK